MDRYRVEPGTRVELSHTSGVAPPDPHWDPNDRSAFTGGDAELKRRLKDLGKEIDRLQRVLWAEDKHKVLIVLQAMDTAGKDGTIRAVLGRTNPQGVRVTNFKVPTPAELAHDYLWRVHRYTPGSGEMMVFNRSHYEDVLVVRVLGLVPEERWRRRYRHIREFEQLLVDEGTTILKFYLNIDTDTQKQRLQARLDDPEKNWKFSGGDLDHRKLWDDYMEAYEDAISETSTAGAPWFVVPANDKRYRNYVVAETIAATLRRLDMRYPEAEEGLDKIVIE